MATIKVQPGQSMWDVVIGDTGSAEAAMQFCWDNGVSISAVPVVDSVLTVSPAALGLGDAGVLRYLGANGVVLGTLGGGGGLPAVYVVADESGDVITDEGGMAFGD